MVLAPLSREPAGSSPGLLKRLRKDGFARVRIDGKIQALDSAIDLSTPFPERIDVVVDRLILNPASATAWRTRWNWPLRDPKDRWRWHLSTNAWRR
jgi:excinuclease UvrABC ATPase subunit